MRFVKIMQGIDQVHSECSRRDQPFLVALCGFRSCLLRCNMEHCQCMAAVLHCDVITFRGEGGGRGEGGRGER